jgi:hypothetical protein
VTSKRSVPDTDLKRWHAAGWNSYPDFSRPGYSIVHWIAGGEPREPTPTSSPERKS